MTEAADREAAKTEFARELSAAMEVLPVKFREVLLLRNVEGMSYEQIGCEVAEHVATITLNRPERLNAYTAVMGHELATAFTQYDADDDVRAAGQTGLLIEAHPAVHSGN